MRIVTGKNHTQNDGMKCYIIQFIICLLIINGPIQKKGDRRPPLLTTPQKCEDHHYIWHTISCCQETMRTFADIFKIL